MQNVILDHKPFLEKRSNKGYFEGQLAKLEHRLSFVTMVIVLNFDNCTVIMSDCSKEIYT
jgi:hypothetical protein